MYLKSGTSQQQEQSAHSGALIGECSGRQQNGIQICVNIVTVRIKRGLHEQIPLQRLNNSRHIVGSGAQSGACTT